MSITRLILREIRTLRGPFARGWLISTVSRYAPMAMHGASACGYGQRTVADLFVAGRKMRARKARASRIAQRTAHLRYGLRDMSKALCAMILPRCANGYFDSE